MTRRDIIEIILSITIGVILWFFSVTGQIYKVERDIEIVYEGIPDSLTFLEPPLKKIKAEIEADGRALLFMKFFKPKLIFKFNKPKKGKNKIEIKNAFLEVSDFIKIKSIDFKQKFINIKLDIKGEKEVPVSARIKGNPRAGFTVKSKKTETVVKLIGPKTILKNIDSIRTEFVSVEKREKSFEAKAELLKPSEVVKISPETASVYIEIEKISEKEFTNVPYIILKPKNYKVEAEPEKLYVRIKGPESILEKIKKEDIDVIINTLNLTEGEFFIKPKIRLPDKVLISKVEPEAIRVTLKKK